MKGGWSRVVGIGGNVGGKEVMLPICGRCNVTALWSLCSVPNDVVVAFSLWECVVGGRQRNQWSRGNRWA